jgi:hypothetical protein
MQKYGASRIAQVMLTEQWYRENMYQYRAAFEDKSIILAKDADTIEDHRAFKVIRGVAKLPEIRTKGKDNKKRHGDAGVAGAMAWFAVHQEWGGLIEFQSTGVKRVTSGQSMSITWGSEMGEEVSKRRRHGRSRTIAKDIESLRVAEALENPDRSCGPRRRERGSSSMTRWTGRHAGSVFSSGPWPWWGRSGRSSRPFRRKMGRPAATTKSKLSRFRFGDSENCNFDQARNELLKAVLYGYWAAEVMWQANKGDLRIRKDRRQASQAVHLHAGAGASLLTPRICSTASRSRRGSSSSSPSAIPTTLWPGPGPEALVAGLVQEERGQVLAGLPGEIRRSDRGREIPGRRHAGSKADPAGRGRGDPVRHGHHLSRFDGRRLSGGLPHGERDARAAL